MANILSKDANGANVPIQVVANTAAENRQVMVLGSGNSDALVNTNVGGLQVYQVKRRGVTPNYAAIASSVTAVTLLGQTSNRTGFILVNDSTATLFIKFGSIVSLTDWSVKIGPGAYYEVPPYEHAGQVVGIWDAANGVARITEFTEG